MGDVETCNVGWPSLLLALPGDLQQHVAALALRRMATDAMRDRAIECACILPSTCGTCAFAWKQRSGTVMIQCGVTIVAVRPAFRRARVVQCSASCNVCHGVQDDFVRPWNLHYPRKEGNRMYLWRHDAFRGTGLVELQSIF